MATIVKRGKIYSIVYRDPLTGKQKWKSVGTDRKVAELALADLMLKLDRIKAGLEPVHRNIRTQDFVREFLDDVDHPKSKSWGKRYQQVKRHGRLTPELERNVKRGKSGRDEPTDFC